MRIDHEELVTNDLDAMYRQEIAYLEHRANMSHTQRLLELLEVQKGIIDSMIQLCKQGEKL